MTLSLYRDQGYNYEFVELGEITHRGPAIDATKPYIVCVGNSFTFGRYVERPYPMLLAERLGIQVLNLGFVHLRPNAAAELLSLVNKSLVAVLQFRYLNQDSAKLFRAVRVPYIPFHFANKEIAGMVNVPYTPHFIHYPDAASHEVAADALYKNIRLLCPARLAADVNVPTKWLL